MKSDRMTEPVEPSETEVDVLEEYDICILSTRSDEPLQPEDPQPEEPQSDELPQSEELPQSDELPQSEPKSESPLKSPKSALLANGTITRIRQQIKDNNKNFFPMLYS